MNKNFSFYVAVALVGSYLSLTTGCRPSTTPSQTTAKSPTQSPRSTTKNPPSKVSTREDVTEKDAARHNPSRKIASATGSGHKTEKATLKDFPSDLALYKGAQILGVGKSAKGAVAGLETKDSAHKVMDFYQKQLPLQGWVIKSATTTKQGGVLEGTKNKRRCIITVGQNPKTKRTTFSLAIVEPA